MVYSIAKRTVIKRGSVHNRTEPVFKYVVCAKEYGLFNSNILVKRCLVVIWEPELINASDEHIKRVCKYWVSGKDSDYKIIKLKC